MRGVGCEALSHHITEMLVGGNVYGTLKAHIEHRRHSDSGGTDVGRIKPQPLQLRADFILRRHLVATRKPLRHGGLLPVRIRAVPEGSVVPTHQALMTIESTDPQAFWVPSYLETMLLRIWYPITVATISWHAKQTIRQFLERTSDDPEGQLPFKLHDFGSRGVSSVESAALGGAARGLLEQFLEHDDLAPVGLVLGVARPVHVAEIAGDDLRPLQLGPQACAGDVEAAPRQRG